MPHQNHYDRLPWEGNETTSPVRIAVLGDVILDEILEGEVNRISPEAPVPVHLVSHRSMTPGGAANSAVNIQKLGGQAFLFGVIGTDAAGQDLKTLLNEVGVQTSGLYQDINRATIRKTRITANHQQMMRIDWETTHPIPSEIAAFILDALKRQSFDAILLADYGKGCLPPYVLDEVFEFAERLHIPVIVDPKGRDFQRYQRSTLLTPNKKEAERALFLEGEHQSGEDLARQLQKTFSLSDILVTLGPEGMIYVPKDPNSPPVRLRSHAREVFDVSGAGDTVAAVMALSLARNISIQDRVHLATLAAGIVVEKWGTYALTAKELKSILPVSTCPTSLNEHEIQETLEHIQFAKKQNKRIVFTNGCFDILHPGHIEYLKEAKSYGDLLVVGLNTDHSIRLNKGADRPINPLSFRTTLLQSLRYIDFVIPFDSLTPIDLIEQIKPDILVKGDDYTVEQIVGAQTVLSYGGQIKRIKLLQGHSTTTWIHDRLKDPTKTKSLVAEP